MKTQIDNYFLGISDEDLRQQKMQVRKVKQDTVNMLRSESKKLIRHGF